MPQRALIDLHDVRFADRLEVGMQTYYVIGQTGTQTEPHHRLEIGVQTYYEIWQSGTQTEPQHPLEMGVQTYYEIWQTGTQTEETFNASSSL